MSAGAAAFEAGSLQDAVFCFQAAADFHPTPPPNVASVALSNLGLVSFLNSHTHTHHPSASRGASGAAELRASRAGAGS